MDRADRLQRVAAMLEEAKLLAREDDPVLGAEMHRVVAILHQTRQLLDPDYLPMRPMSS